MDNIYDSLTADDFAALDPLFEAFDSNPFTIGDYINSKVWGEAEYQKLADHYDVKANRLKTFSRVAREVPQSKRVKGVAFGVYEWLVKISDVKDRWELFQSRSARDWKVEDMKGEVTRYLSSKAKPRNVLKAGNRLGGYKIDMELIPADQVDPDRITITVWARGEAKLLELGYDKRGMELTLTSNTNPSRE